MFFARTVSRNIKRQSYKSLIVVLVSAFLALFLLLYMGNISANQNQLSSLPEAIPVPARISNIAGTQTVGLIIEGSIIEEIRASGFIKNLWCTSRLAANFAPETPEQENGHKQIVITATNDISAFPIIIADDIQYIDGISHEFLQGHGANAIVQDVFLQVNSLALGDKILLSLYSIDYGKIPNTTSYNKVADIEIGIVGSFAPSDQPGNTVLPSIICSAGWAEEILSKYDRAYYADSATFAVKDPLNLNDFKTAMKKIGLAEVNSQSNSMSIRGETLIVNDKTFIQSAGSLKKNLALMYSFFPLIFVIIILVGYITSYLLTQNRHQEFALMRSLGATQRSCEGMLTVENLILALPGCLIGTLTAAIIVSIGILERITIVVLLLTSYMIGAFFAVHMLGKFSVLEALAKAE